MNSLMNYGDGESDDDYDSDKIQAKDTSEKNSRRDVKQPDANYEEVQMDLSEDSSDDSKKRSETERKDRPRDRDRRDDRHRYRRERRHRRSSSRERRRSGSRRRSTSRRRSASRDRKRSRSRRRSSSRERRHGRSRRSRSKGRYPRKYPSGNNDRNAPQDDGEKDRFFMPGITGRFRDQIERRKLLWQKKSEPDAPQPAPIEPLGGGPSRTTKIWEATTFAQDQDGKVASKFKRLMGIKGQAEAAANPNDVLKKQDEMFRSMEQQYEVARTATHTMRGVGLGFSTYPR